MRAAVGRADDRSSSRRRTARAGAVEAVDARRGARPGCRRGRTRRRRSPGGSPRGPASRTASPAVMTARGAGVVPGSIGAQLWPPFARAEQPAALVERVALVRRRERRVVHVGRGGDVDRPPGHAAVGRCGRAGRGRRGRTRCPAPGPSRRPNWNEPRDVAADRARSCARRRRRRPSRRRAGRDRAGRRREARPRTAAASTAVIGSAVPPPFSVRSSGRRAAVVMRQSVGRRAADAGDVVAVARAAALPGLAAVGASAAACRGRTRRTSSRSTARMRWTVPGSTSFSGVHEMPPSVVRSARLPPPRKTSRRRRR